MIKDHQITSAGLTTIGGAATANGAMLWAWLGENNEQLTVLFGAIGALCAIGGFIVTLTRKH